MPVFEFRCRACGVKFATLVGMTADGNSVACTKCGATEADKLVSRFMKGRTEDDRVDEMADRLELYGEPDGAHEMRSMVREMGKAMEEDMADEMEEMFESDMEGKLEDDI